MPRDKHRDFRRNHQCRLKRGCRDGRPGGHRYRLPQSIQVPGEPHGLGLRAPQAARCPHPKAAVTIPTLQPVHSTRARLGPSVCLTGPESRTASCRRRACRRPAVRGRSLKQRSRPRTQRLTLTHARTQAQRLRGCEASRPAQGSGRHHFT